MERVPGWVRGHEALFEAMLAASDWEVWTRPMLVSLSAWYGVPLTCVSANLCRDGRDSVAWHANRATIPERSSITARRRVTPSVSDAVR